MKTIFKNELLKRSIIKVRHSAFTRSIFSLFSLFSTLSLAQTPAKPVKAMVTGTQSNIVYIHEVTDKEVGIDSAIINSQQFIFPINYKLFALYSISFKGIDSSEHKVILYPTAYLRFNKKYDLNTLVKKDSINHLYKSFRTNHLQFIDKIGRLSSDTGSTTTQDSLYKEREKLYNMYTQSFRLNVVNHSANPASAIAIYDLIVGDRLLKPNEIKELYSHLSESVIDSYYGSKIGNYLNHEQRIIDGSPAPRFQLPTNEGQLIDLDQFKGKYVLLNFWASWCAPCRLKNGSLRDLESKLSDDLRIMSVSLDTDRSKWLDASKKDKITWLNTCDLQGFKSSVVEEYSIGGIPKTFLLSPQGVIVGTDLPLDEIERIIRDK